MRIRMVNLAITCAVIIVIASSFMGGYVLGTSHGTTSVLVHDMPHMIDAVRDLHNGRTNEVMRYLDRTIDWNMVRLWTIHEKPLSRDDQSTIKGTFGAWIRLRKEHPSTLLEHTDADTPRDAASRDRIRQVLEQSATSFH